MNQHASHRGKVEGSCSFQGVQLVQVNEHGTLTVDYRTSSMLFVNMILGDDLSMIFATSFRSRADLDFQQIYCISQECYHSHIWSPDSHFHLPLRYRWSYYPQRSLCLHVCAG